MFSFVFFSAFHFNIYGFIVLDIINLVLTGFLCWFRRGALLMDFAHEFIPLQVFN